MTSATEQVTGATGGARVAVLERRGKFLVAEPFFGSGPRLVVTRDRNANVGDLVVVSAGAARNRRGSGRATVSRRLGRPDVARDVLEGLMIDRGLRRSFDPAVEHDARDVASIDLADAAVQGPGRRDLRDLPTFTIDPATARDFDDAISAEALEDGSSRVWVHIADVSAYVRPRSAGRPRGLPARHERVCPRRRRADAAHGPVQQRLLAGPRTGSAGRHRGTGVRRRRRQARELLPVADPLRRAPRVRVRRPGVRGQRARGRALGRAAGGRAPGSGGAGGSS